MTAILVTVGTDIHPFNRLVVWADEWAQLHPDAKVIVQYGTSNPPVHAEGHALFEGGALGELFASVDVVVAAGGPGGLLEARAAGRKPVAVPRRHDLGEHVDEHQSAFVAHLGALGLVYPVEDRATFDSTLARACAEPELFRCPAVPLGDAPGIERTGALVDDLVARRRSQRGLHRWGRVRWR